jgi:hypothetical protein
MVGIPYIQFSTGNREREKENPELLARPTANAAGNPDGTNAWVHTAFNPRLQTAISCNNWLQSNQAAVSIMNALRVAKVCWTENLYLSILWIVSASRR